MLLAVFQKYADKMTKALILSSDFETPSTIGIFAPWGSGKTKFLNFISKLQDMPPTPPPLDVLKLPTAFFFFRILFKQIISKIYTLSRFYLYHERAIVCVLHCCLTISL